MSNTKDINVLVRKKSLAITFTWSNEAKYNLFKNIVKNILICKFKYW